MRGWSAITVLGWAAVAACGDSGGGTVPTADAHGDTAAAVVCGCPATQECGVDPCGEPCATGCDDDAICVGAHCAPRTSCDRTGFTALTQAAEISRVGGVATLAYQADSRAVQPFERIVVRSFERLGGPLAPGTYPITDANYADCALCVLGYEGCSQAGCARAFLADTGTLVIDEIGQGKFSAVLSGVRMREVSINDSTYHSIPVPDGESWCIERFTPRAPLVEEVETDTCVAAGTGREVGDKIANFTLTNCLGEPVALHDSCGDVRAVWVVLAAGWCSACAEHLPEVAAVQIAQRDFGLQVLVALGEDADSAEPTLAFCLEYAASMGLDPASVVIDWRNGESFATFREHLELYSPEQLGLPWEGVLDGLAMRYLWAGPRDGGNAGDVAGALLAK